MAGALVLVALLAPGPVLLVVGILAMTKRDKVAPGAGLAAAVIGAAWTVLDAYLLHWFFFMPHSKGRLLRIGGKAVRARSIRSTDWVEEGATALPGDLSLDRAQRQRLAAVWTLYASMEHASVPAFGRLAESLVRLGAPAALVRRAHEAALDEIRHAQRCYAVASALSGAPVGPAPLAALDDRPRSPARERRTLLVELAHGSLRDGALAEGVAAANARAAAAQADPWVRPLLTEIATDEARHAQLGADVVAWCLGCEPSIAAEIPAWIAAWQGEVVSSALLDRLHEPWMERHGVLAPAILDAMRAEQLAALARAYVEPRTVRATA